ncbi:MAG: PrsW family intramembrane metalloprotease [Ruminococcus sp.]|nr:PrsW family intramembrane metalloprotease [Ruminococcus sp.]
MAINCPNCGQQLLDGAGFCRFCGQKIEQQQQQAAAGSFCASCGSQLLPNAAFCPKCGTPAGQTAQPNMAQGYQYAQPQQNQGGGIIGAIYNMTGEAGQAEIKFGDLFSETFKSHSREERDELVICGTKNTTPREENMVTAWPKPWLFGRVFLTLGLTLLALYLLIYQFENILAYPGLMFVGAMLVPFPAMILMWELNVPRNVSIVDCVSIFFVGGALSLIYSMIGYAITENADLSQFGSAVLTGFIEEIGKAVAVAYYLRKRQDRYILNGLVIGACVGAGFAVFETAGYLFRILLLAGHDEMMKVLWLRAFLAIGGHVLWAAVEGAALLIAKGDNRPFTMGFLWNGKFIGFFMICVALHAIWDAGIEFGSEIYLPQILCSVGIIIVTLTLVSAGLKQAVRYSNAAKQGKPIGVMPQPMQQPNIRV